MKRATHGILSLLLLLFPGLSFGGGGGVEGYVQYRGERVSGAYVEVFPAGDNGDRAAGAANTGSEGEYSISLPPGTYRLTAKKRPEGPGSGGMLYGSSGDRYLEVGREIITVPAVQLRDMGAGEGMAGEIRVSGSVKGRDGPLAGAYVYFYPSGLRRGPGYVARARTGEEGRFTAGVASGDYTVTVRFSLSGDGLADGMGTVSVGDLVGDYASNPLQVSGAHAALGTIELRPVDPSAWEKRQWARTQDGFQVSGQVVTEDGAPLAGAYIFVYDDRRMVGKPVSISAPTGGDGHFRVAVSRPGSYYLGARTRYGGPVEPGEFMGSWDEKGPRPVILGRDAPPPACEIVVREVW